MFEGSENRDLERLRGDYFFFFLGNWGLGFLREVGGVFVWGTRKILHEPTGLTPVALSSSTPG